jgi:ssDNA-binding Zn-finger/Zn-ribbon topoisomerase 1
MKFLSTFKKCDDCNGGLIHYVPPKDGRPYLPSIAVYPSMEYWINKARVEKWPVKVYDSFKCIECGKKIILENTETFELEEITSEVDPCNRINNPL